MLPRPRVRTEGEEERVAASVHPSFACQRAPFLMRCVAAIDDDSAAENVAALPPNTRLARLKTTLTRLHSSLPLSAQPSAQALLLSLIEGKESLSAFTRDYEALSKRQLGPQTRRLLDLALPQLREEAGEAGSSLQRNLLYNSLFPPLTPRPQPVPATSTTSNLRFSSPPSLAAAPDFLLAGRKRPLAASPDERSGKSWRTEAPDSSDPRAPPPTANSTNGTNGNGTIDVWAWYSDEWRHIENLFTALSTSMERLRYSMLLFQQRARLSQLWTQELYQRQPNTLLLQRKADLAVAEVKRVAVTELGKAVTAAEAKAAALVSEERARLRRQLAQEERPENCANCARVATLTCSACNKARYCGAYCQTKDWSRHRETCVGGLTVKAERASPTSTSPSLPTVRPPTPQPHRTSPNETSSHDSPTKCPAENSPHS